MAAIAVLSVFGRAVAFSFIGLDDAAYTFRNPFVAGGLSLGNVIEAFANIRHGGIWMPVTYTSYMIDASFCRMSGMPLIGWMHFVNILLHCVNAMLLGKLLFELGGTQGTANGAIVPNIRIPIIAFAILLWALHPLRVEPVAWIAGRKELLWTLFSISGIICWAKDLRCATIVFCALACLSKPTAMCFPFLAILVSWRMRTVDPVRNGEKFNFCQCFVLVVLFLMSAFTAAIAAYSQTHVAGQAATSLYAVPFAVRFVNALSAIGFYIRATFLPFGLHIDCRAVSEFWPLGMKWNICTLALFALICLSFVLTKVKALFGPRKILFDLGWAIVSLGPTLGLLGGFGIEAHADRFSYLPAMALSLMAVDILEIWRWNGVRDTKLFQIASVVIIAALSCVTFVQLGYWRDDATAHVRALFCDPGHPRAMVHVADAKCARQHDFDGGIRMYRQALACADTVPKDGFDADDVTAKLAYALASRGRAEDFDEIKRLGAKVLQDVRRDRRGMMLDALGTAFRHEGDRERAARLFKASIEAPDRFWPKASTIHKLSTLTTPSSTLHLNSP